MKTSTVVLIIVAIIVVLGAAWYWLMPANTAPETLLPDVNVTGTSTDNGTSSTSGATGSSTSPMTATVTYNGTSFSPKDVTIAKGGTVTFKRQAGTMNVASDEHPTHTEYNGTTRTQHCPNNGDAFDQCTPGDSYSFTFTKTGTWEYHNHANPGATGTVTVK
jgi:plastocyanin